MFFHKIVIKVKHFLIIKFCQKKDFQVKKTCWFGLMFLFFYKLNFFKEKNHAEIIIPISIPNNKIQSKSKMIFIFIFHVLRN